MSEKPVIMSDQEMADAIRAYWQTIENYAAILNENGYAVTQLMRTPGNSLNRIPISGLGAWTTKWEFQKLTSL